MLNARVMLWGFNGMLVEFGTRSGSSSRTSDYARGLLADISSRRHVSLYLPCPKMQAFPNRYLRMIIVQSFLWLIRSGVLLCKRSVLFFASTGCKLLNKT